MVGHSILGAIGQVDEDSFYHPFPLSTFDTRLISQLWPGMHVEIMEGEATGGTEPFRYSLKSGSP